MINQIPLPAEGRSKRIMIVEDEGLVAIHLEDRMNALGFEVVATVDNAEEAIHVVRTMPVDLALMDINLRGVKDGIDAANEIRQSSDTAVIFLTSHADDETVGRAGLSEPFGYVIKPFQERELRIAVEVALGRTRAEQRLRKMQRWFSTTLQSIGDGVIAMDRNTGVTYLNPVAEALTGWSTCDALGQSIASVLPILGESGRMETTELVNTAMNFGLVVHLSEEKSLISRTGRIIPIDDSIAPLRDNEGWVTGCVIVFRDKTEHLQREAAQKRMETKLQETQRLESLGVLAGGIAHDFNNLLTVVTANASIAESRMPVQHAITPCLQNILEASDRAAQLCSQMLAYAGKGRLTTQQLDLNNLTRDTTQLLRVAMGQNAKLQFDLSPAPLPLVGDLSQLQQIIMNLVINGSEALNGAAGTVTVRTRTVTADAAFLSRCRVGNEMPPGSYHLLEVEDTGHGMTPETLARIFDPFYTTKFTGRGLGLAAVLGIIRSHRGALLVESTPGAGTKFQVFFPPAEPGSTTGDGQAPARDFELGGKLLLVDDDDAIRSAAQALLENAGFEIESAVNGQEGVDAVLAHPGAYRAVILDLMMPVMDGHTAFQHIREHSPQLPVLIMSGYSDQEVTELLQPTGPAGFVQKPFTLSSLTTKLANLLGAAA